MFVFVFVFVCLCVFVILATVHTNDALQTCICGRYTPFYIELYQLDFKRIIECRVLLAHVTLKANAALKVEGRLGNLIRDDCSAGPGSLVLNEGRVRHVERRQRTGWRDESDEAVVHNGAATVERIIAEFFCSEPRVLDKFALLKSCSDVLNFERGACTVSSNTHTHTHTYTHTHTHARAHVVM